MMAIFLLTSLRTQGPRRASASSSRPSSTSRSRSERYGPAMIHGRRRHAAPRCAHRDRRGGRRLLRARPRRSLPLRDVAAADCERPPACGARIPPGFVGLDAHRPPASSVDGRRRRPCHQLRAAGCAWCSVTTEFVLPRSSAPARSVPSCSGARPGRSRTSDFVARGRDVRSRGADRRSTPGCPRGGDAAGARGRVRSLRLRSARRAARTSRSRAAFDASPRRSRLAL